MRWRRHRRYRWPARMQSPWPFEQGWRAYGGDRHVTLMASAGARLLRTFAAQVGTMPRLRDGGSQYVRVVEHVHLEPGAQAIVGNVEKSGAT
jgi:hypothetical protein